MPPPLIFKNEILRQALGHFLKFVVHFLGAVAKLQKATISFVMSVCMSVRIE